MPFTAKPASGNTDVGCGDDTLCSENGGMHGGAE
jgi:hypothetical protein